MSKTLATVRGPATLALFALLGLGAAPAVADTDAVHACAEGASKGAVEPCRDALDALPGNVEVRRNLAFGLLVAGQEAESLATYEAIAEERPNDAIAQFDYGVTLIALHHYEPGADALARAIQLDPNHLDAQLAAGIIFTQLGRREQAFDATRRAAELGSDLAMYELSEFYRLGYGTKRNDSEAFRWLLAAAGSDHVAAIDKVVEIYLNGGYGITPDAMQAEEWAWRGREVRGGE